MHKLTISLKRVQTFIFEVPRLKAMLGANALLGGAIRHELTAEMGGRGCRLDWPEDIQCDMSGDPLNALLGDERKDDWDDPPALYAKGILARDGGHFIAAFPDKESAEAFRADAEAALSEKLPGVRYDIGIAPLLEERSAAQKRSKSHEEQKTPQAETADERSAAGLQLSHLPIFQICEDTGREPASHKIEYKRQGAPSENRWVGRTVKWRWDYGDKFNAGNTNDIIGLMREALYPDSAKNWSAPDDIGDLTKYRIRGADTATAHHYLALIHADGNRIGQRYNEWRDGGRPAGGYDESSLAGVVRREAHGEAFFHSMRVAVRRSVVAALDRTFPPAEQRCPRPYQVLMLGGDDLLLACRADKALEFSLNYALELQTHPLADGKRLDVAIGVAIAQHTYPLHRLQELAESLASSAKRLYRALPDEDKQSVIDWQVVTQSWFEDVEDARRRSEMISYGIEDKKSETLLLSRRPYKVLCGWSLEQLLYSARELESVAPDERKAARSALRSLRGACEQGRLSGELAFARLPAHVKAALGVPKETKKGTVVRELWEEVAAAGRKTYATRAMDIVDIYEIGRLGRAQ